MSNNYVDETGLHTQTLDEIIDELVAAFQTIYGTDINLDPNSPDGQVVGLFGTMKKDMLDLVTQVYNSYNPERALGTVLDQRLAINAVIRKGATNTIVNANITTDRIVVLNGLDTSPTSPFTISSPAGNMFYLAETATCSTGSTALAFQAKDEGNVTAPITTYTISTPVLGVLSATVSTSATTQGEDGETDPEVRLRRQKAVSLASCGWLDGMVGNLEAIEDVTNVLVLENNTSSTGSTATGSLPPHSMWAIVEGGLAADIGEVIYNKRNAGCGMVGSESVSITQVDGRKAIMYFDRPVNEDLYITSTITSFDTEHILDIDTVALANAIYEGIILGIHEPANSSDIISLMKSIDPLLVVDTCTVGPTGGLASYAYPSAINNRFVLSTTRISLTVI